LKKYYGGGMKKIDTNEKSANKLHLSWQLLLVILLATVSGAVYFIHYVIFKDPHRIFIYMVEDIAFIPIEVFFVTLIIHRLLEYRDKRSKLKKLNMGIGAFYSEVGNSFIKDIISFDSQVDEIRKGLLIDNSWTAREFNNIAVKSKEYRYSIETQPGDLVKLKRSFWQSELSFLGLLKTRTCLSTILFPICSGRYFT
jgi:hypothetical protein